MKTSACKHVPRGTDAAAIAARRHLIVRFYAAWKAAHPRMQCYNRNLNAYINIRHVSVTETAMHASKSYLSTLAVLQLEVVLACAVKKATLLPKKNCKNQGHFDNIIIMECNLPGIGRVKLTVGVLKATKEKVQYCITAIT